MKFNEFNDIAIDMLTSVYGPSQFPSQMLDALYKLIQDLSASDFKAALMHLSEKDKRVPTLATIRSALSGALARNETASRRGQIDKLLREKGDCASCHDSGWCEATKQGLAPYYRFAFICDCGAAEILGITTSQGVRKWTPEIEKEGYKLLSLDLYAKIPALSDQPDDPNYIPF